MRTYVIMMQEEGNSIVTFFLFLRGKGGKKSNWVRLGGVSSTTARPTDRRNTSLVALGGQDIAESPTIFLKPEVGPTSWYNFLYQCSVRRSKVFVGPIGYIPKKEYSSILF